MQDIQKRITAATTKAQEVFWASMAESFPEIKSGDFPPDACFAFDVACTLAATVWVKGNLPAPEVSSFAEIAHGGELDMMICSAIGELNREQLEDVAEGAFVHFHKGTTNDELRTRVIGAAREQRGIKIYGDEGGVTTFGFHNLNQLLPVHVPGALVPIPHRTGA